MNMFLVRYFAVIMLAMAIFAHPVPSFAATPPGQCSELIPCGCDTNGNGVVDQDEKCDFNKFITLAQNVINFLIFKIAAPLAAVMFAYAGFLYVTNKGNESQVKQAHDVFLYVFIGLVIALAAWLVVNFILEFFLGAGSDYNLLSS